MRGLIIAGAAADMVSGTDAEHRSLHRGHLGHDARIKIKALAAHLADISDPGLSWSIATTRVTSHSDSKT